MSDIKILVATMTGTAEIVAEEIQSTYGASHTLTIHLMDKIGPEMLSQAGIFLIVSSTYGAGDIPDPAQRLFEAIEQTKPDLRQVRYGVVALGDSTYKDTFAFGGKRWDALLSQCSGRRIGDILVLDASAGGDMVGEAVTWASGWLNQVSDAETTRETAPSGS